MSYGDNSVFTFNLNESLWFKKGQEVDEIMGISLEPEISIQEFDEYISVRGVIELNGEYFQVRGEEQAEEEDENQDQVLSLRNHPSQRFVDRIESNEDGVNEFFHNFPVEVSIPKYRVESLDDVMVGVEAFDYELPENSQLKLSATVAIHGVNADETERDAELAENKEENEFVQEDQVEESIEEPTELPVEETFQFDVKEAEEEVEVDKESDRDSLEVAEEQGDLETQPEPEAFEEEKADKVELTSEEEVEEKEEESKKPEKDRWKNKKSQTLAEFFGNGDSKKAIETKSELEEKAAAVAEEINESSESSIISFSANKKEESSDESIESSREAGTEKDTSYLLNIFADKDEERFSSMKMCIVQESDTLESLAEKYKISPINISKTNRLMDDDLSEGQILYIPTK